MSAYYNEVDSYAAKWLRNLIAAGLIAPGDVDERSIVDVDPSDLAGFTQCHFFAGIGGWSLALQLAGWPGDRPVWTGSCPCQPLSSAGQRKGHADERHLWPAFHALIAERRPATVFGEQVAGSLGREWLAGVRADLEAARYAVGAADLCAAGVGAPHIRQRLFWVANTDSEHATQERSCNSPVGRQRQEKWRRPEFLAGFGAASRNGGGHLAERNGGMADSQGHRRDQQCRDTGSALGSREPGWDESLDRFARGGLGYAVHERQRRGNQLGDSGEPAPECSEESERWSAGLCKPTRPSPWSRAEWLPCLDGKARRVEPTIQPLAHSGEWGSGSRVGVLRGAGNAIVPPLAAEFVASFMEAAS